MRRLLFLVAFLAFCAVPSFAQDSEFSGGGGTAGAITAAPGSGNAGRVPQFASTTSLVDSKMLTSGTNSGTWTLYDSTGGSGVSQFDVTDGAGQGATPQIVFGPTGANLGVAFYARPSTAYLDITARNGTGMNIVVNGLFLPNTSYQSDAIDFGSGGSLAWHSGANYYSGAVDIGLNRSAAGILKVTDGSTGQGGIGISDAATNTVTDALILRHATTDAGFGQDGFGTGLLFQAENDVGTMHDAASIDAVLTDSADTSEDSEIRFSTYAGGAEVTNVLTIGNASSITTVAAPVNLRVQSNSSGYVELITPGTGHVYLGTQGAGRWQIEADGDFSPLGDNSFDIGTSAAKVKDSYLGTSIQGTRTQAISAEGGGGTEFVEIAVASGASVGGFIEYTVQADDGTDREIESGVVSFTATNEAGTEAANVSILGTPAETPGAALTVSFDVTTGLTNVFRVKVISDSPALVPTTHKIEYRVHVNSGTTTVTPLT